MNLVLNTILGYTNVRISRSKRALGKSMQNIPQTQSEIDTFWMQKALVMADKAQQLGEVPVGAVLVDANNDMLAQGFNQPIQNHDPSAHAEIQAIRLAGEKLQNYRLIDTTLYVTLEPCAMCAAAIVHARIKRVVFAADDLKTGAAGSFMNYFSMPGLNHYVALEKGVCQQQASTMLSNFFAMRRKQIKAAKLAKQQAQRANDNE